MRLEIRGPEGARQCELGRNGVLIGRRGHCDVVLSAPGVSGEHARIYPDPFGRWIVEDLGSKNGIRVGGQPASRQTVLPGDRIEIGPFALSIAPAALPPSEPDTQTHLTASVRPEEADQTTVQSSVGADETLSVDRISRLNEIGESLSRVTDSSRLYAELCRALAGFPGTAALVLSLPSKSDALPSSPPILGCCVSADLERPGLGAAGALHLSHRVLEAVRSTAGVAAASNRPMDSDWSLLTLASPGQPRTVACAPIAAQADSMEVLYVDLPSEAAGPDILDFVQAVARMVRFLRTNLLLSEQRLEHQLLERQLQLARNIQQSLLPKRPDARGGVELAWHYQPATWVGGDFCDVFGLPDGRLAFAVGDVCDKGLHAAMVMAAMHAALRSHCSSCPTPSAAMERVNRYLTEHLPSSMFATLVLGFVDLADGSLQYVNAGHIQPLVLTPDGGVSWLGEPRNFMLGVLDAPFVTDVATLGPRDCLVVATDGVTESISPQGRQFGGRRLRQLLRGAESQSMQDLVNLIVCTARDFRHPLGPQDDVTVLALRRSGQPRDTADDVG